MMIDCVVTGSARLDIVDPCQIGAILMEMCALMISLGTLSLFH